MLQTLVQSDLPPPHISWTKETWNDARHDKWSSGLQKPDLCRMSTKNKYNFSRSHWTGWEVQFL